MPVTPAKIENHQVKYNLRMTLALLQATLFGLVVLAGLATSGGGLFELGDDRLIYPACALLLGLAVWSLFSWQLAGNSIFDPYGVFLIAAWLFNAGQAFLEVFHLNDQGLLGEIFSIPTTLKTIYIVGLGIMALHLGALVSSVQEKRPPVRAGTAGEGSSISPQLVRRAGLILLLISAVPTILTLRDQVGIVLSSGYLGLFQQSDDQTVGLNASASILAEFLIPAALFLLAGSKGSRSLLLLSAAVILTYAMTQFFLGSRNKATLPLIAYVWLWNVCIKPLPKTLLLSVGAVLVFLVFPIIAASRDTSGPDRVSGNFLSATASSLDNPAVASISEMGGTMQVVGYTLDLVPSEHNYEYGGDYLYAGLTIFPNFFWSIHPTIAHGTPGEWISWAVDPWLASRGGGLGYSFLAEAYLNFGWIGTPLVLGLFGFFFAKFVLWAGRSRNLARLALLASSAAYFPFFARADASLIIRPFVWYALLPFLLVYFLAYLQNSKLAKTKFVPSVEAS